jgi:hypothetical protein
MGTHVDPQLRVEVRQRLVHQERRRLAHDRASHCNPLTLATRKGRWTTLQQVLDPEHLGHLADPALDLALRRLADA